MEAESINPVAKAPGPGCRRGQDGNTLASTDDAVRSADITATLPETHSQIRVLGIEKLADPTGDHTSREATMVSDRQSNMDAHSTSSEAYASITSSSEERDEDVIHPKRSLKEKALDLFTRIVKKFTVDYHAGPVQVTKSHTVWRKSGTEVTLAEAHNTRIARKMLKRNENIHIKVPKVYAAFQIGGRGVIYMQHIKGEMLYRAWPKMTSEEKGYCVDQLKQMFDYLQQQRPPRGKPAISNIRGGPLKHIGLPANAKDWFANKIGPFSSVAEFHQHLICPSTIPHTLRDSRDRIAFDQSFARNDWYDDKVCFCHADINAANILIQRKKDKPLEIYVIDWETAGWWPAYTEYAQAEEYERSWRTIGFNVGDVLQPRPLEQKMFHERKEWHY